MKTSFKNISRLIADSTTRGAHASGVRCLASRRTSRLHHLFSWIGCDFLKLKIRRFLPIAVAAVLCGCAPDRPISYTEPLTSPGGIYSKLPPAVQNTVRAEAGTAEIGNIVRVNTGVFPVYVFYFKNSETFPPLYVASDGSVLTSNLTVAVGATKETIEAATGSGLSGIRMSDLPPTVVETIRRAAPTAVVHNINRLTSEGDVFYEVTFEEPGTHPRLLIRDDGHLVR